MSTELPKAASAYLAQVSDRIDVLVALVRMVPMTTPDLAAHILRALRENTAEHPDSPMTTEIAMALLLATAAQRMAAS